MQGIAELERRFWLEGAAFYEKRLSDGCVMVFPGQGELRGAGEVVRALERAPRWTSVAFEPELVWISTEAVLIAYEATARREGAPPYRTQAASLYVREAGEWRLRFHQQTPAADS